MAETTVASLSVELKALTTKFEAQMERATKSVARSSYGMKKSLKTVELASKVALGKEVIAVMGRLGQAFGNLANYGDELDDLRGTFEALGGTSGQLDAAKNALLGTVSSVELLKIANQGLIKEIPDFADKFGTLAEYAGRFAEATGTDAVASLDKLVGALARSKTAQLQKLGIVINEDKAYKDYAATLGTTADALTNTGKTVARQTAAYDALLKKMEELPKMGDSVNAAQSAVTKAFEDARAEFGMGIAANVELQKAYRQLEQALKDVDWRTFGEEAAKVFGMLASWGAAVLPPLIKGFKDAGFALRWMFSNDLEIQQKKVTVQLGSLIKEQRRLKEAMGETQNTAVYEALNAQLAEVEKQISVVRPKYKELSEELDKNGIAAEKSAAEIEALRQSLKGAGEQGAKGVIPNEALFDNTKQLKKLREEAEKAQEEMERWQEKWADFNRQMETDQIGKSLEEAVSSLDKVRFDGLIENLRRSVEEGFTNEWQDAIKINAVAYEDIAKKAKEVSADAAKEYQNKFEEATNKVGDDLVNAFDQVAASIGRLSEAIGVDLSNVVSELNKLPDKTKADIASSLGMGGEGSNLDQYIRAATTVITATAGARKADKASKSNKGTGGAVGAGVGAAIGTAILPGIGTAIGAAIGQVAGEMIGSMIKWGPQNPNTQARHAFANFVEEGFQKLGAVSFRDAQNRMRTIRGSQFNFLEGATTRFNDPNWVNALEKLDKQAKSTFIGLGEGLKNLLGITEDVGGQIGALLAENLSGNIDNARLLVAQLGVSFADLEEALMKAAMNGTISWSEFEIQLVGAADAFKPGLAAVGDLVGAMDALIGSGGRGVAALKSVRDTAVEAMEAGARTIEEMGQRMIAQGVDPTAVNAFILAIRERGISTLQELADVSDRVAGGIVAELASNDEAIRSQWGKMADELKGIAEIIETIPTEKDIKLNVQTNFDKNTQQFLSAGGMNIGKTTNTATAFANGGVVSGPMAFSFGGGKMGIAGEAGAEAILPLTKVGGKLGVMAVGSAGGGGNVYHIDARGADIGVEKRIRMALIEVENRAVRRSVNAMGEGLRRGGRL
jgi:chemotaxis protein histidine kinase CheA